LTTENSGVLDLRASSTTALRDVASYAQAVAEFAADGMSTLGLLLQACGEHDADLTIDAHQRLAWGRLLSLLADLTGACTNLSRQCGRQVGLRHEAGAQGAG
jgi:hypothetical protein